ncbi:MAG: GDSL-type esterase/lipase family protein [Propionicimonas sp.]
MTLAWAVVPGTPAQAATTYKVSYDANGGKGAPKSQTKKKGVTLKLSSKKPTRSTYTFKWWVSDKGVKYQPGGTYTINGNLKLRAVWHLNYVALGDSYSSGEGAKPEQGEKQFFRDLVFGTRACHRSPLAYGELLDADLSLQLKAFGACTGATTRDVTSQQKLNGKKIAKKQLDYVNSSTGLITITIGGNDINFEQIARACVQGEACTPDSTTIKTALKAIRKKSFAATLASTYAAILTKAPKAKLVVIGYPQVGPGREKSGFKPMCAKSGLSSAASFYPVLERDKVRRGISQGIHLVIGELNDVISMAAVKVNGWYPGRVFYVSPNLSGSPFAAGHLCTDNPHINDVVLPLQYSLHPNYLGHRDYAKVVGAYIKGKKWAK